MFNFFLLTVTCLVPDATEASVDEYRLHRYRWGVPEGVIDLPQGESLPLESNLEYMNGGKYKMAFYFRKIWCCHFMHNFQFIAQAVSFSHIYSIDILVLKLKTNTFNEKYQSQIHFCFQLYTVRLKGT